MTQIGTVYGEALYDLAAQEQREEVFLQQLQVLEGCFTPAFLQLLSSHALSPQERCQILEESFSSMLEPYLLNFLKLLTERGYARYFPDCCRAFGAKFDAARNILPVTAVTAVPLTPEQSRRLTEKLAALTGKNIRLHSRIDAGCLGGVRLDYDGSCLDDTLAHRLQQLRQRLKNTVL